MTLAVVSNPAPGGSTSAEPAPAANGKYYANGSVTLTAQPYAGYVFVNWSGNTGGIPDDTLSSVTVVMSTNRSLAANFVASSLRCAVATASEPSGSGTVALSPSPDPDSYPINQTVTLSATPNPGYVFSHWTGDATATAPDVTLLLSDNKSVTAVFNPNLSVEAGSGGSVDVYPLTSSGYPVGTVVNLMAHPSLGYLFAGWTGDVGGIPDAGEKAITVTMDAARTLTANFVASSPFSVSAVAQTEGSGSMSMYPVQPSEGYPASQEVTVYALAASGYTFSHWTGDVSGANPILALDMDGDKNVVAVFDARVAVKTDPAGYGEVEITPPCSSGGYAIRSEVVVEAEPAKGYRFKCWDGDASGSDNPTTITVDSPKTVTALFVKDPAFPWWLMVAGILGALVALVALRLVYVFVRNRPEPE